MEQNFISVFKGLFNDKTDSRVLGKANSVTYESFDDRTLKALVAFT
jgi:hypothetical protein